MTRDDIAALPKVELHLHLDCSMSLERTTPSIACAGSAWP